VSKFWRNRRTLAPVFGELGCGLITVIVFTLPLWAFSAAARGPRFALALFVGLLIVLGTMAVVGRLLRRR